MCNAQRKTDGERDKGERERESDYMSKWQTEEIEKKKTNSFKRQFENIIYLSLV